MPTAKSGCKPRWSADIDSLVDYVGKACDAAGCGEGYALPEPEMSDLK